MLVVDGAGIEPASLLRCPSAVFQPLALTALSFLKSCLLGFFYPLLVFHQPPVGLTPFRIQEPEKEEAENSDSLVDDDLNTEDRYVGEALFMEDEAQADCAEGT